MALLTNEIKTILTARGMITYPTNEAFGAAPNGSLTDDPAVEGNFTYITVTASVGDNTITITREKDNGLTKNGVDVQTLDGRSVIGTADIPGYVYTGNFSGCVYYLYKTAPAKITGVHAYSGMVSETSRKGLLRKKVINQVVREFSPQGHFARTGGQLLDRYETRGEVRPGEEDNLAFLSCVERTTVTTFLFSTKRIPGGSRVVRLLRAIHLGY